MFRRRINLPLLAKLKQFVWPNIGWRRALQYWIYRVSRLPDSTHAISAGFAFGAAISFTPFVGLHLILAGLLAWICRASILASAIGTFVGNPWTFPFIWIWIYQLGIWMGVGSASENNSDMDFAGLFGGVLSAVLELNFDYLLKSVWPILSPMLIGAIPTAIISWVGFYLICKYAIRTVNKRNDADPNR